MSNFIADAKRGLAIGFKLSLTCYALLAIWGLSAFSLVGMLATPSMTEAVLNGIWGE